MIDFLEQSELKTNPAYKSYALSIAGRPKMLIGQIILLKQNYLAYDFGG
jgi:hypothetical protein